MEKKQIFWRCRPCLMIYAVFIEQMWKTITPIQQFPPGSSVLEKDAYVLKYSYF
jgi:hypothetical protein